MWGLTSWWRLSKVRPKNRTMTTPSSSWISCQLCGSAPTVLLLVTWDQYWHSPACFPSVLRTNQSSGKLSQWIVDGGGPCPVSRHWMSLDVMRSQNWSRSKTNQRGRKQNNCKLTQSSATTHSHVKLSQTTRREAGYVWPGNQENISSFKLALLCISPLSFLCSC